MHFNSASAQGHWPSTQVAGKTSDTPISRTPSIIRPDWRDDVPRAFRLKRIYEPRENADGLRVLVDRLWPRGIKKSEAHVDKWLKAAAPSPALRTWFGHDPARWAEFRIRYRDELEKDAVAVAELRELLVKGPVTLLYAARDEAHTHALVLKEYLEESDHRRGD